MRRLLHRLKVSSDFDPIVLPAEVGEAKPSKTLFEKAITALKVPKPSIFHVGDSPMEDVTGAQAAGKKAVLLDRGCQDGTRECIMGLDEGFDLVF